MTWEIFLGLVALVTFVITISKPIVALTKAMTTLNVTVNDLKDSMSEIVVKNQESHKRLWDHNGKQDNRIDDHEKRISKIETRIEFKNEK